MYLTLSAFLFVSWPSIIYLCLLLSMPSWRWLIAATSFGLGYYVLQFFEFNALPFEYHNSINGIFARFGHYYVVFYTLSFGFAARAFILRLQSKGAGKLARNIATISALALYLSTPFIFSAYAVGQKKWDLRAPPAACPIDAVPVQIAKERLRLPAIPNIRIMIGDGTHGDTREEIREGNVLFLSKKDQRRYCRQYKNGRINIHGTSITIRPLRSGDMQDIRHKEYCETNNKKLADILCPRGEHPFSAAFSFIVFHAKGAVARRDIINRENNYSKMLERIGTLKKSEKYPFYWEDKVSYYWIDDSPDMRSFDGEPIVFSCLNVQKTR
ncbi:MAG TPA: hypothetical protein VHP34_09795, partial [Alphaproteobacteria bacterium]|nr:hypothetical protein [Alphaproteobacteria bacterium]